MTVYTTEEQLLASDEFLGFCGTWERDRWCPAPFADWLLENVGDVAFQAAMWAVETEERSDWCSRRLTRVFPSVETHASHIMGHFYWMVIGRVPLSIPSASDYVPLARDNVYNHYATFAAAIACYVLYFDVELAKRYPPKLTAVFA